MTRTQIRQAILKTLDANEAPSAEGIAVMGIALLLEGIGEGNLPDFPGDVAAFQERFNDAYQGPPRCLPKDQEWRFDFLLEEIKEMRKGHKEQDIAKEADANLDLIFLALGNLYLMGFPIVDGWREIVRSNMTKEVVEKGKGKFGTCVHKGKDYTPPDLNQFLPTTTT